MDISSEENLIELLYEAAFLPESWVTALDIFTKIIGGTDAAMYVTDGYTVPNAVTNPKMRHAANIYLEQNWMPHNELASKAIRYLGAEFARDTDLIPLTERNSTKIYPGYFIPNGLNYGVGSVITGPTNDVIVVSFHRGESLGPFDLAAVATANRLRPHIARAGFIASRLKLERLTAALAALEAVGLPAAALSATGRLLQANSGFQSILPDIAEDRRVRLRLTEAGADAVLAEAIAAGLVNHRAAHGCSVPLPARGDRPPIVLHLVPVTRETHDVFPGGAWILVAAPVLRVQPAPTALLEGLFDLTPAEARVARRLMTGDSVSEIADAHAVSHATIRSQLSAIFRKTGTGRQVDLLALLSGVRNEL